MMCAESSSRPTRSLSLLLLLVGGFASAGTARGADKLEYNRDIRPILSENCFRCHGPDSGSRKGNLRLDLREAAVEAGAIAPGDPSASELVERVFSHERDVEMPPRNSNKVLTDVQRQTLKTWIAQGAEYQPHWAFIPPKRPTPPEVSLPAWSKNPIDRFLLAEMTKKGLAPSPEADKPTLARRVALDLTGLPPTPSEVDAFVADTSPDAYEKLVDRYLASPHWGEHRARYWLDAARYADTHGIHFDNFREMWSYRDWVINAFNKNVPFDTFTIEQIAGDILPQKTLDQQIASGFNRCNITTNEGGAIAEEYQVLYTRDRTETVSQVYMGLTAGCAVCHDHKFDPISQKEFYSLAAFFNNTTQSAMDGNVKDTPPIVFVPASADRDRWSTISAERDGWAGKLDLRRKAARTDFDKSLAAASPASLSSQLPTQGQTILLHLDDRDGTKVPRRGPGGLAELADAGNFDKDKPFSVSAWIRPTKAGLFGAIASRMDEAPAHRGWDLWVENDRPGMHLINTWPDDAIKIGTDTPLKLNAWNHVLISYDGSAKASGIKVYVDGVSVATRVDKDALKGSTLSPVPFKVGQRKESSRTLESALIGEVRVFARAVVADDVSKFVGLSRASTLLEKPADKRPADEVEAVFNWWLGAFDAPSRQIKAKLAQLDQQIGEIKARGTVAHVMNEKAEPAMAYLLFRGDYDKRRDPLTAETPKILPKFPSDYPKNRLGLAKWLLLPEHPLTARVTVNRFWQELFGNGLVRTSGDFGVSGELPSHPELLDWLSVEFREKKWDIKALFRSMVTSAAYRQSEVTTAEAKEKDPQNRYYARGPRYRMDAEMVRDYALATSGLLVDRIGGPSVRPYQPDGVWEAVAMIGSNTRDYKADSGDGLYRRSLYTFWKRSAPPASMDIFNAPSREVCAVRRERTNTPLQALVTLNDVQFVEAARNLAQKTLVTSTSTDDDRLNSVARTLIARDFRPEELTIVKGSLKSLEEHYKGHADDAKKLIAVGASKADPKLDPARLAAWTMIANELMNLDEVLNK